MKNFIVLFLLINLQLKAQQIYNGLEINYDPCTGACSSTNTNYGATENLNDPDNYVSDFGPRDVKDD